MATGSEQLKRGLEAMGDDESNKRAKHEGNESVASDDGCGSYTTAVEDMDDMTLAVLLEGENRRNSPLLKLPGELRNHIYGYLALFRSESGVMPTSEYRRLAHVSRQLRTELHSYTQAHGMFYMKCERHCDYFSYLYQFRAVDKASIRCVIVDISKLLYTSYFELTDHVRRINCFLDSLHRETNLPKIVVGAAHDVNLFRHTIDYYQKDMAFADYVGRPDEAFDVFWRAFGEGVIREQDADWYSEEAEYKGDETDEEETDEAEDEKMEVDWAADWDSDEDDSDWHGEEETGDGVEEETEKETEV
ncbi:hypothetical protein E8E13_003928 [Curvularia kusanoi]|uniref:Uncharacterized protein n=1 Tax=Curvularia kusanoi TaxID=90978 RepID=A0A9P4WAC8_CURKU|nr:hypothetical protein E8E13_003928 [Curvularia kusanoi]